MQQDPKFGRQQQGQFGLGAELGGSAQGGRQQQQEPAEFGFMAEFGPPKPVQDPFAQANLQQKQHQRPPQQQAGYGLQQEMSADQWQQQQPQAYMPAGGPSRAGLPRVPENRFAVPTQQPHAQMQQLPAYGQQHFGLGNELAGGMPMGAMPAAPPQSYTPAPQGFGLGAEMGPEPGGLTPHVPGTAARHSGPGAQYGLTGELGGAGPGASPMPQSMLLQAGGGPGRSRRYDEVEQSMSPPQKMVSGVMV